MSANDKKNVLLKDRVQKSKSLDIRFHGNGEFATWGSNQEKYYWIKLSHEKQQIETPDGTKEIYIFNCTCQNALGVGVFQPCKGNEKHTICYHCLGALRDSFNSAKMEIAFYNTYHEAINGLNFGGEIAKVVSTQGKGILWAVFRRKEEKPKTKNVDNLSVRLMRGNEDDEGID